MTSGPVVVDTNVVVSGLLTRLAISPTARIFDAMLAGRFRFLLSIELLAEYREVLLRPKIRQRHRLSESEIDVLLTEIAANGVVLEIEAATSARARPRRSDGHLWEILAARPEAALVTGDQRLLESPLGAKRVLTPRAFADALEG